MLQVKETPIQVDAAIKTPLNTNSFHHVSLPPVNIVKEHGDSPFKIKPRKLVLTEIENDDSGKANKQTANEKSVHRTKKNHANSQKQPKTIIVFEDSPTTAQGEKLPLSNSRGKQRSIRTLKSKTSQKETYSRHRMSEHDSLSKVCQALEFNIDSPDNCSKIHQPSAKNRKQIPFNSNVEDLPPNVIDDKGINLTYLGLQGLHISNHDNNNDVLETLDIVAYLKQVETLNIKPGTSEIFHDKHAPVLKATKPLRTYSRQNSENRFTDKSKTSQKSVDEEEAVKKVMDNGKTKTARKQTCSARKGVKKMSPCASLTARKTRGRGKYVCSYSSTSVSSKSPLQGNSNETVITDMENLALDSEKIKLFNDNDSVQDNKRMKDYKKVKKGLEFLFTPSRKNVKKECDETIVSSSSPDEHLNICVRQSTLHLKNNKGNEWKEKVIPSSSASEDDSPPNLKPDISGK